MGPLRFALFDFFSEDPPTVEVGNSSWIEDDLDYIDGSESGLEEEVSVLWPQKSKPGKVVLTRCAARVMRFSDDRVTLVKLMKKHVNEEELILTPELGRGKRKRMVHHITDEDTSSRQIPLPVKRRREQGEKKAASRLADTLLETPKTKKTNIDTGSFKSRLDHIMGQSRYSKKTLPVIDDDSDGEGSSVAESSETYANISDIESVADDDGTLRQTLQRIEEENRKLRADIGDLHETLQSLKDLPRMVLDLTQLVQEVKQSCRCNCDKETTTPARNPSTVVHAAPLTPEVRVLSLPTTQSPAPSPSPSPLVVPTPGTLRQQYPVSANSQLTNESDVDLALLSGNVYLPRRVVQGINRSDPRKMTMDLMSALFTRAEMATHTLTGVKSNAKPDAEVKPPIDQDKITAIQEYCLKKFPGKEKIIREAMKAKLNGEQKCYRRMEKH